jgi:signal transduction histidine kinase
MPLLIESPDMFYARVRAEDAQFLTLLALCAGMAIISTIYLTGLGMRLSFVYGTYILLATLHLFHTDGYSFMYLWPNAPIWNQIAIAPIGFTVPALASIFTWAFIDARRHHPFFNAVLPLLSIGLVAMVLYSPWGIYLTWYKNTVAALASAAALFNVLAGIASWRRGLTGAGLFTLGTMIVALMVLGTAIGYLNPGTFNQDLVGLYGRFALIAEGLVFSLAIFMRTLELRKGRDAALLQEIRLGDDKLKLSEALRSAETNYQHAVTLAERDRVTFASAAHDIRQPLTSLRMALMRMSGNDSDTARQVSGSFDYLDKIIVSNLQQIQPAPVRKERAAAVGSGKTRGRKVSAHIDQHDHRDGSGDGMEQFAASVVLNNIAAMFRDEARAKGIKFRVAACNTRIRTKPVAMMRIVSNLVSNAVKYTDEGGVLVVCRKSSDKLHIDVHDTGPGLDEAACSQLQNPHVRGENSNGFGLGLAVSKALAEENGMRFSMRSKPGRGTIASVAVPLAASK